MRIPSSQCIHKVEEIFFLAAGKALSEYLLARWLESGYKRLSAMTIVFKLTTPHMPLAGKAQRKTMFNGLHPILLVDAQNFRSLRRTHIETANGFNFFAKLGIKAMKPDPDSMRMSISIV
jgi:hypothetical protein